MKLLNLIAGKCFEMLRGNPADKALTTLPIIKNKKQSHHYAPRVMEVVATKKNTKIGGANWLADFKNNQFSEHGEDGIITKIFEILTPENKWVCEFGAHDPENISNTWKLIHHAGWHAVLIEADEKYFDKLQKYYQTSPQVHCLHTKISYEGSNKLDNILKETPAPADLDFMVIDIDGNDYHVWEAIDIYKAKVVMIEFNATIPTDVPFVQPRDLRINQGSSLKAMVELGIKKGYKLLAVTSWNAFFVQNEYYHLFFQAEPLLEDLYVFPARQPNWMRPFQLYDGTIAVAPCDQMLWHKIELKENDYQALPEGLRYFSRTLAAKDYVIEAPGKKVSVSEENQHYLDKIFNMPGNVLSKYAKNYYSRYGEDGILEKLISSISAENLVFVDVGAGDAVTYSRSRVLAHNHRWKGLLIENDLAAHDEIKKHILFLPKISLESGPYGLDEENNLDFLLKKHNIPSQFDVLFLNDYGMEYYLWESLQDFSPNIVAVQFNPTIANDVKFIQAKDFSIHQGCSLRALLDLAHYKGYELAAVTLETAFFVKRKYSYRLFETLGLKYAELDDMFCPVQMYWFQLYDGTIVSRGLTRFMWNGLPIDEEKLQVVPKALREFHQYADQEHKPFFYRV